MNRTDQDQWICVGCADARKGVLRSGLIGWRETCSVCNRRALCRHIGEYDWPTQIALGASS